MIVGIEAEYQLDDQMLDPQKTSLTGELWEVFFYTLYKIDRVITAPHCIA